MAFKTKEEFEKWKKDVNEGRLPKWLPSTGEELTTAMHEELIGDEIPHFDLMVLSVYGAIKRGVSKQEALEKYGISEKEYNENIERALSQP